jgi:hypothetical protein
MLWDTSLQGMPLGEYFSTHYSKHLVIDIMNQFTIACRFVVLGTSESRILLLDLDQTLETGSGSWFSEIFREKGLLMRFFQSFCSSNTENSVFPMFFGHEQFC